MSVAQTLVDQFSRMVSRDGGQLELLGDDGDLIRIGYRLGAPPADCDTGACILPHVELQEMMAETLARKAPDRRLVVVPIA